MTTNLRAWTATLIPAFCLLACGCRQGIDRVPTEAERIEQLRLMLPQKIQIQPFTSIRSFNDDETPDGILLVLRPVDVLGDPVKAAGHFWFELWTYVNASGERKGERLAFWEQDLNTESDIQSYWTHAQMYEFPLAWVGQGLGEIQPGRRFILRAVWRTPWDETVSDEYVLDFSLPFGSLINAPGASPPEIQESDMPPAGRQGRPATRPAR